MRKLKLTTETLRALTPGDSSGGTANGARGMHTASNCVCTSENCPPWTR